MELKNSHQCFQDIEDSTSRLQERIYEILGSSHLSYTIEYAGIEFSSQVPMTDKELRQYDRKRRKLVTKLVSDYLHAQAKYVSSTSEDYSNPAETMIRHLEKSYIDPAEAQSFITVQEYEDIKKEATERSRFGLTDWCGNISCCDKREDDPEYEAIYKECKNKIKGRALNYEAYQVKVQNPKAYADEDFITDDALELSTDSTHTL